MWQCCGNRVGGCSACKHIFLIAHLAPKQKTEHTAGTHYVTKFSKAESKQVAGPPQKHPWVLDEIQQSAMFANDFLLNEWKTPQLERCLLGFTFISPSKIDGSCIITSHVFYSSVCARWQLKYDIWFLIWIVVWWKFNQVKFLQWPLLFFGAAWLPAFVPLLHSWPERHAVFFFFILGLSNSEHSLVKNIKSFILLTCILIWVSLFCCSVAVDLMKLPSSYLKVKLFREKKVSCSS